MSGGLFTFYAKTVPATHMIPIKIIHNSVPKNKTVVIKLLPGSSISTMGPFTTFTYTGRIANGRRRRCESRTNPPRRTPRALRHRE